MNRRTIAIIVFIIGLVLLSVVALLFLRSQDAGAPEEQPTPQPQVDEQGTPIATVEGAPPPEEVQLPSDLPPMVEVVVSLQTVPRGWRITENEVTTDMRVAGSVPSNVVFRVEDVIGKYARNDIYQGETFTFADIAEDLTLIGAEEYGPSSLIPPGFIAASLPIDRISSVAYGVEPGDYVDIMITFAFWEIDEKFQTLLPNAAVLYVETTDAEGEEAQVSSIQILDPLGRFEELPTGELVYISPSEAQRPIPISMILQNAKVIQVGAYEVVEGVATPTPSPEPTAEGAPTATPAPIEAATATPEPPKVVVLALQPQQQLLLKYAIESNANIDLALRGVNDGQLYEVENIDLDSFLERFDIEVPPNMNYSVDTEIVPLETVSAETTPESSEGESP